MHSALTVRMFTRCVVVTLAGLLFLAQARTTEAAPIVLNDRTAFNAAAQPNVFEDFSAPVQCTFDPPFCDLFYSNSNMTFRFDNADLPGIPAITKEAIGFLNVGPTFEVTARFGPSTAVGFDVSPLGTVFGLWVAPRIRQLDGTEAFGDIINVTQPGFVGFHVTDGTLLTGLGFAPNSPDGPLVAIDNVAATVPVPEPATLLLFGAGASVVVARRRQRRG